MHIRNVREEDHASIITVIEDWLGCRPTPDMLPKLFFQHFQETSFAVEENGQFVAFLVGFVSQTHPEQAYIHFVGVHPDRRKQGLVKELYERFFSAVQERGCTEVHVVTSPMNMGSIAFHTRMGFEIEPGDGEVDGVQVKTDYDGHGQRRVQFVRRLTMAEKVERPHSETILAQTPEKPYYAVIFTSVRTPGDNGYADMADEMVELAQNQPGFLGIESVRDADGIGITVSYWDSEESIRAWKENGRHLVAQKIGREKWYESFVTRVCRVERAYDFNRGGQGRLDG
ncbi:hypothetical protein Alches_23320 [Alicyclobacillus hesperidum subsp. aegles]|uniref:GNAT family N-acetyltransferase n=1 Tax=Alicyclobacillus hesperidum TaxID=89784 RepID=UPI00222DEE57|nr:GNAT family N-acetyltransferase [Alicyclobacillus hesperidum]GLG02291.1 hypothetical protein Alches_23320 [Alicyclobacillus hesperidum subsp. aegles]